MSYRASQSSPYDAGTQDTDPETPDLGQVLLEATDAALRGMRFCMPGQVAAVNGNQKVDVQPMLQARYGQDATPVNLPVCKNVPVVMAVGGGYSIKLPLAVGDNGLLLIADRSIDVWCSSRAQSPVDPQDTRQHDLSDAVFVPGLVPFALQTTDNTSDLVLTCGNAQLRLEANGRVKFGSSAQGGQELLALVDQLIQNQVALINLLMTNTFTLTMMGPQPFIASTIAALSQLNATAQTLQTNLETIKAT